MQIKHTKTKDIIYNEFKIQPYISDSCLSNKSKSVLFAIRSSMTRGIRKNFSSMYFGEKTCPIKDCDNPAEDDQQHLLTCSPLQQHIIQPEKNKLIFVKYDNIFGTLEEQRGAAEIFTRLLEIREEILQDNSLPVDSNAGPRIFTTV